MSEHSDYQQWDQVLLAEGVLENEYEETLLLALPTEAFRLIRNRIISIFHHVTDPSQPLLDNETRTIVENLHLEQLSPMQQIQTIADYMAHVELAAQERKMVNASRRARINCAAAKAGLRILQKKRNAAPHASSQVLSEIICRFATSRDAVSIVRGTRKRLHAQYGIRFSKDSLDATCKEMHCRLQELLGISVNE